MECKFADLTIDQLTYCISANIDRMIVTYKQMMEIEDIFNLRDEDADLTAIRNSVVENMGALTSNAIKHGNFELFEQLQANMSGITATIDHVMTVRGC